jgi:ribosomal protein S18 acetylase RimI-like enzyme
MGRASPWTIRPAGTTDLGGLEAVDPVARSEAGRREELRRAAETGCLFVAMGGDESVGFVVFEHSFFGRGFIVLLVVAPSHRRAGVGSALVRFAEERCRSERIFVSTNVSNRAMRVLLGRAGYERSGVIRDLDPGDPELVFSKALRADVP